MYPSKIYANIRCFIFLCFHKVLKVYLSQSNQPCDVFEIRNLATYICKIHYILYECRPFIFVSIEQAYFPPYCKLNIFIVQRQKIQKPIYNLLYISIIPEVANNLRHRIISELRYQLVSDWSYLANQSQRQFVVVIGFISYSGIYFLIY